MTQEQFGQMVEQYEKLVYTICYQFTRNHHTAQDLAQDTFLSAYSHIESCPQGAEKPWLARIATNKAKDFLKSAYNRRVTQPGPDATPDAAAPLFMKEELPEDIVLGREVIASVTQDIMALKEPYHKVAVLYFLEEKKIEDIAQALQRPPKTVHTQLYRAKRMLQQKLQGGNDHATVL